MSWRFHTSFSISRVPSFKALIASGFTKREKAFFILLSSSTILISSFQAAFQGNRLFQEYTSDCPHLVVGYLFLASLAIPKQGPLTTGESSQEHPSAFGRQNLVVTGLTHILLGGRYRTHGVEQLLHTTSWGAPLIKH